MLAGLVAIAFVAGSITTSSVAFASNAQGQPFQELQKQIDDILNGAIAIPVNWADIIGIPADIADGDDVNDADSNPTNELQSLSLSGQQLSISGGNTVTLSTVSKNVVKTTRNDMFTFPPGPNGRETVMTQAINLSKESLVIVGADLSMAGTGPGSGGNTILIIDGVESHRLAHSQNTVSGETLHLSWSGILPAGNHQIQINAEFGGTSPYRYCVTTPLNFCTITTAIIG